MPLVGFLAILLLAAGVYIAAERRRAAQETAAAIALQSPSATWTAAILGDATPVDVDDRVAIVERLGIVGSPWVHVVLEDALADEPEPEVREAIWRVLVTARTDETASP